jgi:hypothetical protein
MGLFDNIETAKVSMNRYIRSGHYLARIDAVKAGKNRFGDDLVAIEMTGIYTFPDGQPPSKGEQFHAPGEAFSDVISRKGAKDMYLGRVKAFITSVTNEPESAVTAQVAEIVTGATQPLKGLIVEVFGRNIVTKAAAGRALAAGPGSVPETMVAVDYRGQMSVTRLRKLVPADQLSRLGFDEPALVALAAKQTAMGVAQ